MDQIGIGYRKDKKKTKTFSEATNIFYNNIISTLPVSVMSM